MKKLSLAICMILSSIAITLQAQSNSQLSIQGVLRNANGTAVENGPYDLHFRLWDAATNGNMVWEEEINQVDVEGGIYSAVLGSGATPLDAAFTEQYFLGVSVEGGTELIPRAPLTSSPYALSLIGSDNIFPNSGNVGVGASAPQHKLTVQQGTAILALDADLDAGNTAIIKTTADGIELDAGGTDKIYSFNNGRIAATADEQFTVEGAETAQIILSNSNGNATLGFDATNGDDLKLSNTIEGSNIILNTSNGATTIQGVTEVNKDGESLKLIGTDSTSFIGFYPEGKAIGRKGFIGFSDPASTDLIIQNEYASTGRITFKNQIYANGARSEGLSNYERYRYDGHSHNSSSANQNIGFVATYTKALIYYASSDARIKKDFRPSLATEDLSTLMKIKVKDYKHKDAVKNGTAYKKGLIAQEVLEVFPEAVKKSPDLIPSIYEFPTALNVEDGTATFQLPTPHGLVVGEVVKMIFDKEEERFIVSAINSPKSFSIENWEATQNAKDVFVYGKEVEDFHTVDYDRVFTLNVSATQELARKVAALEKENARLKNNASQTDEILKSLSAKVEALEQNLQMTGQK